MIEKEKVQFDIRQLGAMAQQVSLFQRGEISLPHLIQGIGALMNLLEASDPHWKESLKSEWWTLEQIYAVALDRNQGQLSRANFHTVSGAVRNISTLIAQEKERMERQGDR